MGIEAFERERDGCGEWKKRKGMEREAEEKELEWDREGRLMSRAGQGSGEWRGRGAGEVVTVAEIE